MPTEPLSSHNKCKHCNEMFADDTGSDTCIECKIDRHYIKGQCPFCKQYLELNVFDNICTHKLPPCSLLRHCNSIREFSSACIYYMEQQGMRVFYKSITGFPESRLLKSSTNLLKE